jgi:hypothetical protein
LETVTEEPRNSKGHRRTQLFYTTVEIGSGCNEDEETYEFVLLWVPLEFFGPPPVCAPEDRYGKQGSDDTSFIDVAFRVITYNLYRSLYPFYYFSDSDSKGLESVSG